MDLQPVKTTFAYGQEAWLASREGTEFTESVTLDLSKFTAATHYPDGYIPAGAPLVANGTSHMYEPAADAATTCDGHLFMNVKVNTGATKAAGPLLVGPAKVRISGIPFANTARAAAIRYL